MPRRVQLHEHGVVAVGGTLVAERRIGDAAEAVRHVVPRAEHDQPAKVRQRLLVVAPRDLDDAAPAQRIAVGRLQCQGLRVVADGALEFTAALQRLAAVAEGGGGYARRPGRIGNHLVAGRERGGLVGTAAAGLGVRGGWRKGGLRRPRTAACAGVAS
jgi:hypothetical protein